MGIVFFFVSNEEELLKMIQFSLHLVNISVMA